MPTTIGLRGAEIAMLMLKREDAFDWKYDCAHDMMRGARNTPFIARARPSELIILTRNRDCLALLTNVEG